MSTVTYYAVVRNRDGIQTDLIRVKMQAGEFSGRREDLVDTYNDENTAKDEMRRLNGALFV